ncbi:hypothetical protein CV023_07770 [Brevibacterium sp. CCUG 69071]|nr:hypothetical protein [Brevibacterium sp. CCUG 69071]
MECLADNRQVVEVGLGKWRPTPVVGFVDLAVPFFELEATFIECEPCCQLILLCHSQDGPDKTVMNTRSVASPKGLVIVERVVACVKAPWTRIEPCHGDETALAQEGDQIGSRCEYAEVDGRIVEEID